MYLSRVKKSSLYLLFVTNDSLLKKGPTFFGTPCILYWFLDNSELSKIKIQVKRGNKNPSIHVYNSNTATKSKEEPSSPGAMYIFISIVCYLDYTERGCTKRNIFALYLYIGNACMDSNIFTSYNWQIQMSKH